MANNIPDDIAFVNATSDEGLVIGKLRTDGTLERCPTKDHPEGENGAYWFNAESRCGWYQNWEKGGEDGQLWFSTAPDNRTEGEKLDAKLKANEEIESKAKARAAIAARVAREAPRTFAAAMPTDCHRYLENKGVASHGLRIDTDGVTLLVPVRDIDGNWQTLQRIAEDGSKKFIRGGKMKRGMFTIGDIDHEGVILIGEGFATMATLFEITGYACICAFNAGNIPLVAEIVHERYPNARICICCDDDHNPEAEGKGNAGLDKGRKAAEAIGAAIAIPVRTEGSDFNDMGMALGFEEVERVINEALSRELEPSMHVSENNDDVVKAVMELKEFDEAMTAAASRAEAWSKETIALLNAAETKKKAVEDIRADLEGAMNKLALVKEITCESILVSLPSNLERSLRAVVAPERLSIRRQRQVLCSMVEKDSNELPSNDTSKKIEEINKRFAFIDEGCFFWDMKTDEQIKFASIEHRFAPLRYNITLASGEVVDKPVVDLWLKSPKRREHSKVTYKPGTIMDSSSGGVYNCWKGWGFNLKHMNPKTAAAFQSDFKLLILNLVNNVKADAKKLVRWLAWGLQHPTKKNRRQVVLVSPVEGTGKSMLGQLMCALHGEANSVIADGGTVASDFNDWLRFKTFMVGEELFNDPKNATKVASKLKVYAANDTFPTEAKFEKRFVIPNLVNFMIVSNMVDAIHIDLNDRRYEVYSPQTIASPEFYARIVSAIKNPEALAAIAHFLLNLDLTDYDPNTRAEMSDAKKDMIEAGWTELEAFIREKMEDDAPGPEICTPESLQSEFNFNKNTIAKEQVTVQRVRKQLKTMLLPSRRPNYTKIDGTRGNTPTLYALRNVKDWREAPDAKWVDAYRLSPSLH